jgi:hypothetical protein
VETHTAIANAFEVRRVYARIEALNSAKKWNSSRAKAAGWDLRNICQFGTAGRFSVPRALRWIWDVLSPCNYPPVSQLRPIPWRHKSALRPRPPPAVLFTFLMLALVGSDESSGINTRDRDRCRPRSIMLFENLPE